MSLEIDKNIDIQMNLELATKQVNTILAHIRENQENASVRYENTMTYFKLIERQKALSQLLEAYPETMTLKEMRDYLSDKIAEYRNILFFEP